MAEAIKQRITLEGAREIEQQLAAIGPAGQRAFQDLQQAVESANRSFENAGNGLNNLLSAFGAFARVAGVIGAAAVAASAAIGKLAENAAKAADGIGKAAQRAGEGAENYQKLRGALEGAGLSAGDASTAAKKFGDAFTKAGDEGIARLQQMGSRFAPTIEGLKAAAEQVKRNSDMLSSWSKNMDPAQKALQGLGGEFDATTGKMKPNLESWLQYADAVKGLKTPLDQSKAVLGLFGDEIGRQLLPHLQQGREGLKKFMDEYDRMQLGLKKPDIDIGTKLVDSMKRLSDQASDLKTKLGLLFAEDQATFFDTIEHKLAAGKEKILEWATVVRDGIRSVQNALRDFASQSWEGMWDTLKSGASSAWESIVSGAQQVFGKLPEAFRTVLSQLGSGLSELLSELDKSTGMDQAWQKLKEGAQQAFDFIKQIFGGDLQIGLLPDFESLRSRASEAWEQIKSIFSQPIDFSSITSGLVSVFEQAANTIIDIWNKVIDTIRQAAAAASSVPSANNTEGAPLGDFQMAGGGHVRGRGTGTSDSIFAMLSNGEFVMRAAAVRRYGLGFMAAINGMRFPGFNMGGIVDGLQSSMARNFAIPRFATGGLAVAGGNGSLHPVVINLNNDASISVMARPSAVDELRKHAAMAQVRSGGRKPSRYG